MSGSPDRAAAVYVGAFIDELARVGVRHLCLAPGSRSAPLALSAAAHPALRIWTHLDERSAAFFALGMARTLGTPVALLCTSGTAAANFLPAVAEARSAGVALLVLTADRPPEMREVGAAQTIDQQRLFGVHAKWFVDVALPEATPAMLRYARTLACRSAALATAAPAGPVHLNFPFREPLVPVAMDPPADMSPGDALAWYGRPDGAPWVTVADAPPGAEAPVVGRLAQRLRDSRRPLFIAGPQPDLALAQPLAALARSSGAPVLADPLSQLRWGSHDREVIVDRYDAALRHEATSAALEPDLIVRVGALPTSKVLLHYLERHAAVHQVVVDAGRWPDPTLAAAEMVHADPRLFCERVHEELRGSAGIGGGTAPGEAADPARQDLDSSGVTEDGEQPNSWLARWRHVHAAADAALVAYCGQVDEPFEGRAVAEVVALIPEGGVLFVSSSMPVRDVDAFAPGDERAIRVLANRGANGIDGVVSSALGAAAALRDSGSARLVLIIGDIALYHDMNGLLAAKLYELDATIVVLNNDGGGIFSFLPQAGHPEHFESLFGTPHGLDFAPVAQLYGASYRRVDSWAALRDGVAAGIEGKGLHLVEMHTDRERNVVLHRQAWAAVSAALDEGMSAGRKHAPRDPAAGR